MGDIEYPTGVHISVREPRGLKMNDLWSFDQLWRSYFYSYAIVDLLTNQIKKLNQAKLTSSFYKVTDVVKRLIKRFFINII